jgi:hypothetical protein
MKKGCLFWLLLYAVFAALYYTTLHGRFTPPADRIGALVGALGLLSGVAAVSDLIGRRAKARENRRLLAMARAAEAPVDGQRTAVLGTLVGLGPLLLSPFGRVRCVAYSYGISHRTGGRSIGSAGQKVDDFGGYAMAPSGLRTPIGDFRLLGFPALDGFDTPLSKPGHFSNAGSWLAETPFEDMTGLRAVTAGSGEVLPDDEGAVRRDWRTAGDDFALVPRRHQLTEAVVRDGEEVCAVGVYSAAEGGLVPDPSLGLKLIRGDGEAVAQQMRRGEPSYVPGRVTAFVVIHLLLFGFLLLHEPGARAAVAKEAGEALFDALQGSEIERVKDLLETGADVDSRDHDGMTPLMLAPTPEIVRLLLQHGADLEARSKTGMTPLLQQVLQGNPDIIPVLLAAHPDLTARDYEHHMNAVQWAESMNQLGTARFLRDAGVPDDNVTAATGSVLPADGGAPFAAYQRSLEARRHGDMATLRTLVPAWQRDQITDEHLDLVAQGTVADVRFDGGYANATAATVRVIGGPAGQPQSGVVQMVFEDGAWRVERETW